jgi:hypothetical protein
LKGSDLGSIDQKTGRLVRLYDPRNQFWKEHFELRGAVVEALTDEGAATVSLLKLNLEKRVVERQLLIAIGSYPR